MVGRLDVDRRRVLIYSLNQSLTQGVKGIAVISMAYFTRGTTKLLHPSELGVPEKASTLHSPDHDQQSSACQAYVILLGFVVLVSSLSIEKAFSLGRPSK